MRRLLVGLLSVVAGCHKEPLATSPKDADALWALAPEGAMVGIVATPRALAMIEHGWEDIHTFVAKAPDLAPLGKQLDEQLQNLTGAPDLRFADYGLTTSKGAALFMIGPDELVMIVPVADRDKFLAKVHGTKGSDGDTVSGGICKDVRGAYVCAKSAVFDKLGKSKLRDKLEVRGDIEVVAAGVPGMPIQSGAGVVQLERGAVIVRGTLAGLPAAVLAQLGAPVKPVVDRDHSSGFGVGNLAPVLAQVPEVPIVGGVSSTQLAHSLAGPLTMSVAAGALSFDMRAPLNDPGPAQTLVSHCSEIDPNATFKDGTCHSVVPPLNTIIDGWVDGKTLHIGAKNAPAGKAVPLTRFGAELADGSWNFALWGRGSMLTIPTDKLPPIPGYITSDPQAAAMVRAMLMIDELGLGFRADGDKIHFVATVRTAWSNPDDVVNKLAAASLTDLIAGKGSALVAGVPSSAPLAPDVEAGYMGLMLPTALVGIMASTAIPAYLDYMHKSKKTEAGLELHYIERNLKVYWETNETFPVGDMPLTPATPCCKGPGAKCPGGESEWTGKPWQDLAFVVDEPHLYQYSYHSDGKTVEVDAVGDLDCDGTAITYRLEVDGTSGKPEVRLEEPPPNTD